MRTARINPFCLFLVLLLLVGLMGQDCNETGDFIRGPESRTFAAAVVSQIAIGVVDAFIIGFVNALAGVTPPAS